MPAPLTSDLPETEINAKVPPDRLRYSLVGENAAMAVEKGLAGADWYTCPVPRDEMRKLLERKDGPAIRDTILWFALLLITGAAGYAWWGTWWALIPFALYGVVYASSSDSRWHEAGHGTAFQTDWLNNALYEIASFMVMRESTVWRWSHARHHSDTIIVGRDPEIAVPRPPDIKGLLMSFFSLKGLPTYFKTLLIHCSGKMTAEERTYVPESEWPKIYFKARIYLAIYLFVIGLAVVTGSILPLMYIGLPTLYGSWLMPIYGYTQHSGLAENVLDHRLNCRTVYMNPVNRYFYWNMNYHVEHHMFPLVPYHALPQLHELVKDDMPTPYRGLMAAYREIIPTVLRQVKDPGYFIKRALPEASTKHKHSASNAIVSTGAVASDGWVKVCSSTELALEDVLRFDHGPKTFAIYRTADDRFYATDGVCTHGNAHLADGMVKGKLIECPKHNGRFDLTNGAPRRLPVCVALKTFPLRIAEGVIYLNPVATDGDVPVEKTCRFRVVSNDNVATFIKELVLEPVEGAEKFRFTPGDYLQLDIPVYDEIAFHQFDIPEPYAEVWRSQHVFDFKAANPAPARRNYSLASNAASDKYLRFNVRIATPPRGQDCLAGCGSAYVFNLKQGDEVTAIGPFGDFHIKETEHEMVYVGGGAGMAPLRAHLSHLLETLGTKRRVSFWYGARSAQEIFYREYFEDLVRRFPNFSFHLALSEPLPGDQWTSHVGFIHEVLKREYLDRHADPQSVEFYLCGPPAMIAASSAMLEALNVPAEKIAFDEF